MRGWQRAFLGALLVGALAIAGIAGNFTLLRLTQDSHDPVGKLSPRAVFAGRTTTTTSTTPTATPDDGDTATTPDGDRDRDD